MAIAGAHQVFGACSVWWGVAGAEVEIGYTRDGVMLRPDPKWGDIQSDDFGGEGGPPSDSQFLGGIATLTVELTKYLASSVDKLASFEVGASATEGTFGSIGTLVRNSGNTIAGNLVLTTGTDGQIPVSGDLSFPVTFLRGGQEVNKGTKFSTYSASWEAWVGTAAGQVLYTKTA